MSRLSRAARGESGALASEHASAVASAGIRTALDPRQKSKPAGGCQHERRCWSLPNPRLRKVYRLEVTLGEPLDFGEVAQGHRRIVPQTGGTFTGPEISGKLLPGASADWQIVLPDGTSFADIRYTLQPDGGDLIYVQSRGVRHGSAEVPARLGRGEQVDAERVHVPHL